MGDFRASIKIEMTLIGEKYDMEWWINYNGWEGIDPRISAWFEKCWKDAYSKFNAEDLEISNRLNK